MKKFSTPHYAGAWFPFDGDRMSFRRLIETHLRTEFSDDSGNLIVGNEGPRWEGVVKLELSYSHSKQWAVFVYSETHRLGVDIETLERELKGDPLQLAMRFFPRDEAMLLQDLPKSEQKTAFLSRWVQKEAYAKFTRLGLAHTLAEKPKLELGVISSALPVTPIGVIGFLLVQKIDESTA